MTQFSKGGGFPDPGKTAPLPGFLASLYHHSKKPTAQGAVGRKINMAVMDEVAEICSASKRKFGGNALLVR
jgi:hypothetical protein